jgi:alkyl sulfatase BDS1-like metallo-beta-lactamase superfamily hydrolase
MTDEDSCHRLTLRHGAVSHLQGSHGAQADAVMRLDRATLVRIVDAGSDFLSALDAGLFQVSGDVDRVRALFSCLDVFDIGFNIVEP